MGEIIKYEEKSLSELTADLTKGQRDYLYLRLLDFPENDALRLASRGKASLWGWRRGGAFDALEAHLLSEKGRYAEEAGLSFFKAIGPKAQLFLDWLIDKGFSEKSSIPERQQALRAVEILSRFKPRPKETEGYEEMLFKVRRKEVR